MSSIDERIVSMKFNNGQFLTGIAATLNALANLKKGLNLDGAKKSVDGLNSSMSKMPPSQLAQGIQGISGKFAAMATVGITALATVTTAAINAGVQIVKSLTVDPVAAGLREYETNLNSIQTILANTGLEGNKGLGKVNSALQKLNDYSDQTIYNFSEMARNIGTFTAAGVDLDTSTNAIKGIANLAAVSGSNSQQASSAMYQLSQALAAGRVSLMDWNSVVNAGMGGEVFQNSLKETARAHGVAVDQIIKDEGSFRDSLQTGWLTSEVLTETLSKFTGDLNERQLKTMGYNDEQIKGILKMGKTATDAATKVKTASQLIGTLQETSGSGWAKTWQLIFGDFDQAKDLFTSINNVLGGIIGTSNDVRNKVLGDWNKLGGRTVLIEAIGTAFSNVFKILKPIGDAFTDIFPPTTGKRLYEITQGLLSFSKTIKIGAKDSENLKSTFAGLFALFSIAGQIISGLLGVVGRLFGVVGEGSSDFLEFSGNIGEWLVKVDEAMKKGDGLTTFFKGLGDVLSVPIQLLQALGEVLIGAFDGFDEGGGSVVEGVLERISTRLEPFAAMGEAVSRAWGAVGNVLQGVMTFLTPFATEVSNALGQVGEAISNAVSTGDFEGILDAVNTGLFAALVLGIRKFLSNGKIFNLEVSGGGLLDNIRDIFGGLTDTLSAMQASLKAGTLIKIAGAIALLTASVVALSLIDSGKLAKALGALTVMFLQLAGAMAVFDSVSSTGSALRLAPMAAGLILLSTAIVILTGAVKILSTLSWGELTKGLTGVIGLLVALSGAMKLMAGSTKGLAVAGVGMIGIAVAIRILASAVQIFATLSWEDMGKGLAGVAGALLVIAGAMNLMPATLPLTAVGLVVVSAAIVMLAGALKIMAGFSWEEIGKSMVVLAGSLAILAGAMYLMTAGLPGAAAMLVIAPALVIMAGALLIMAQLSWEEIGKVMVVLAGGLSILAITVTAMIAALPGAAALIIVAGALAILAPVLLAFGGMSWEEIGKGMVVLAGALAIIGVAGAVLTPVIPTLIGLGLAIALIGVGTLAAGAGILAFSIGLTALSVAGAAGTVALVAIVSALIGLIPMALKAVAEGIVLFAEVIGGAGPVFVKAMTTLLLSLLTAINKLAPKIIDTIWNLVLKLANRVADGYPKLVDAGLRMVTGILNGIANNIGKIATAALNIITALLNGISAGLPRLTDAGAKLVINFVNSIANSIRNNTAAMRSAGLNLASAIVDGMTGGLFSGASSVISAAVNMASGALEAAKNVLGIHSPSREFYKIGRFANQGFAKGLTSGSRSEVRAATKAMRDMLTDAIKSANADIKEAEANLKRLTSARNRDNKAIERARKVLHDARMERNAATGARTTLDKYLADETKHLERLATRYTSINKQLDKARQGLQDAKRTRNDYNKSITDQFSDLGNIEGNTLKGFTTSFKNRVKITREFAAQLQKLRDMGLNDDLYKELLEKGPEALPFLNEIVAGGQDSVNELNTLDSQLNEASKKLGKSASSELYQAGVDAAAGLVKGLQNQSKKIDAQMDRIAAAMVRAIKKRLGIKSPSKVFAEVGDWSMEGLVTGLKKASSKVNTASSEIGADAVTALEKAMSGASMAIDSGLQLSPTVRPVLDLSTIKRDAGLIPRMLPDVSLDLNSAYSTARIAALAQSRYLTPVSTSETSTVAPVTNISYTQNLNSPKAISEVDVYRSTKNLVSTVKGVLNG